MKAARCVRSSCSVMWTKDSPRCCRTIAARWKDLSSVRGSCWASGYSVLALSLLARSASRQPVLPAGRAQPVAGGHRDADHRLAHQHEGHDGPGRERDQAPRGSRQRRRVLRRHRAALLLQRRTEGAGELSRAGSHQHAAPRHDVEPLARQVAPGAGPLGSRRALRRQSSSNKDRRSKEPIQIRLSGENLDKLRQLADQTAAELRAAGGYHVFDDLGLRMPNIQIDIDQDRANSLGLNNQQIGRVAQASFTGLKVTELREGDRLIPVLIRGRIEDRSEAEKIRGLYVPDAGWQKRSLREFREGESAAGVRHDSALQPASHRDGQSLRAVWRAAFRDSGPRATWPGENQIGAGLRNEVRRRRQGVAREQGGNGIGDANLARADRAHDGAPVQLGREVGGRDADRAARTHRRVARTVGHRARRSASWRCWRWSVWPA